MLRRIQLSAPTNSCKINRCMKKSLHSKSELDNLYIQHRDCKHKTCTISNMVHSTSQHSNKRILYLYLHTVYLILRLIYFPLQIMTYVKRQDTRSRVVNISSHRCMFFLYNDSGISSYNPVV